MVNSARTSKRKKKEDQPELTGGEHVFDLVNYYGIGWGLNTALSVWASDLAFMRPDNPVYTFTHNFITGGEWLAERLTANPALESLGKTFQTNLAETAGSHENYGELFTHISAKFSDGKYNQAFYELRDKLGEGNLEKGLETLAETLKMDKDAIKAASDHLVKGEISKEVMTSLAGIMALCAGGFMLMYPVKKLEDNKVHVTKWLDEHVVDPFNALTGNAPKTDEEKQALQEKRQARYDYLEHDAPRQSWASILTGRIASLIPLYILHVSWWKENNAVKAFGGVITGEEPNPGKVGFHGAKPLLEGPGEWVADKAYQFKPVQDFAEWASPRQEQAGKTCLTPYGWTTAIGGLVSSDMIYSFIAAMGTEHISKAMTEMWADKKCSEAPEIPEKMGKEEPLSAKAAVEKLEQSLNKDADIHNIPEMEKIPQRKVEQASRQGAVTQDRGMEAEQLAFA